MTGALFLTINPTNFWLTFILAEYIGFVSTLTSEDMRMIIEVLREAKSFVVAHALNINTFLECHLPYRFNLLMS